MRVRFSPPAPPIKPTVSAGYAEVSWVQIRARDLCKTLSFVSKSAIVPKASFIIIRQRSNREPIIISDVTTSGRLQYPEKAKEEDIRAIVSLPITLHGKIVGALRVYHSQIWDISERDIEHLQVVAQYIGVALMYFRLANAVLSVKETVNEIHSVWL